MQKRMRSPLFVFLMFFFIGKFSFAQQKISGQVTDDQGKGIAGATIALSLTNKGTVTDEDGNFKLELTSTDSSTLIISAIGFIADTVIVFPSTENFQFTLQQNKIALNEVVIAAGSFDLSDNKKSALLKTAEITSLPGAQGDLFSAINLLPGAQIIGDQDGLFIRGGSNVETKTYMDGLLAPNPFFSSLPDIKQRSRFSPFLFRGTFFSTGGFSALYGQALSGVVLLDSHDLPDSSVWRFDLGVSSVSLMHDHRWENTSLGGQLSYYNQTLQDIIGTRNEDFKTDPQHGSAEVYFRNKNKYGGLLKSYLYSDVYHASVYYPDLNDTSINPKKYLYDLHNTNVYSLNTYEQQIDSQWFLYSGISYSYNRDSLNRDTSILKAVTQLTQVRLTLTHYYLQENQLYLGAESNYLYILSDNEISSGSRAGFYFAPYAETNFHFSDKLIARAGLRLDNSTIVENTTLSPRISLGYKTGTNSQLSVGYGLYNEIPEEDYLLNFTDFDFSPLTFERSAHYIINYLYSEKRRMFRVEAFYKNYDHLLQYSDGDTTSTGYGYARGFEIFWRDKKTIPRTDYWISYSFLDTKRLYLDFPVEAPPTFAATHTVEIVGRYLFRDLDLLFGASVEYATGRTYFNPDNPDFLSDRTPSYKNFSVNANYKFPFKSYLMQVSCNINNVFGIDNIYSIRYSDDGKHFEEIKATSRRNISIGATLFLGRKYVKRG